MQPLLYLTPNPQQSVPQPAPGPDATADFHQRLNNPQSWVRRLRDGSKRYYGVYLCGCGNEKEVYDYSVRDKKSLSCGCHRAKATAERNVGNKHGFKHGGHGTTEYDIWCGVVGRGTRNTKYNKNHFGRGIRTCDRWKGPEGFKHFLADMGPRPSMKHQIDRRNNDGDYEPTNCRWATQKEQLRNTRSNVNITYRGRTQCLSAWIEELGLPKGAIGHRYHRGWGVEQMFETPIQKRRSVGGVK